MNPSTDSEILTYLKTNFQRLSWVLPASKFFTNRIRTYQKHLDNLFDYWLNERNYDLKKSYWKNTVQHFLENVYLPHNQDYIDLEKMYISLTCKNISRAIQGEKSDFVEERQDECHVCCNEIQEHISCGHYVCKSCIINSGKETCPLCRKVVSINLEEVRQMNIIKEKMKREKYEEERRQLLSQQNEERRPVTQEELTRMISTGLVMYRTGPLRAMALNILRPWCALYEMHNFSNDNSVYQQARRIIG
jgi:hypothetical protein